MSAHAATQRDVAIPVDSGAMLGVLGVPSRTRGLVIFAHGSGSGRRSPRNQFVANELQSAGLATLLIDLLTADEEAIDRRSAHLRFDIGLLAARLMRAKDTAASWSETGQLHVGYFGASTGAAAAIVAAAETPGQIRAIVSRGGRPDLARDALRRVDASTLLVVGGADPVVLDLNREAMQMMRVQAQLVVIPGATHLFEEPGALEEVARLARAWFLRYLE
jgi:putative phosphoribosyl transferase